MQLYAISYVLGTSIDLVVLGSINPEALLAACQCTSDPYKVMSARSCEI